MLHVTYVIRKVTGFDIARHLLLIKVCHLLLIKVRHLYQLYR